MSDFYSVLRQSILDRDLRSKGDREEAYAQARTALIRQLWAYDPPLAEDEIDARIGQFDVATERIEADLVAAFAALAAGQPARRQRRVAGTRPVVVEEDPPADAVEPEPAPRQPTAAEARAAALRALEERRLAVEAALRADLGEADEAPPSADESDEAAYDDLPEEPDDGHDQPGYFAAEQDYDDEPVDATLAPELPDDDTGRRPSFWQADPETLRVRLLLGAIAVLVLLLAGVSAYVLVPSSDGSAVASTEAAPDETSGASPPADPNSADPIADLIQPDDGESPIRRAVSDSATSARIPAEAMNVAETLTLFDGRDPTVFQADPGNPAQYDGSVDNGIVRISTTSDSSGIRVSVGPGLAQRLAGHQVRVIIEAREARENGAASFRMAYQSGVAISHWQTAKVGKDFGRLGLLWRVPSLQTDPTGDLIIIEPGIPGDGTAIEVKSVTIDRIAD